MSYGDDGLWLGLIKSQSGRCYGPRIAVFSYYGSPTEGPQQLQQESHLDSSYAAWSRVLLV
ncbi:hypothetical protein PENFLA_c013G03353 [Penicillium flavigenum]|uniref:Uncharacterized protein n=1 Tax=Penicillium flavigenum TaxID=254877 RepID=A0A1V6T6Z1_9EURO|nr:hypothetical protein PENFLA_c013G03353 [Penicillium flavigenum]